MLIWVVYGTLDQNIQRQSEKNPPFIIYFTKCADLFLKVKRRNWHKKKYYTHKYLKNIF